MNLIEQLGGYEKAKEWHDENTDKEWVGIYHMPKLYLALLEHRRQHNIFEVGDRVFYTGRANDNDLYTLKEIYSGHDFVVGSNGADKDFWTLFISEIRHATPEEIQAGHRL